METKLTDNLEILAKLDQMTAPRAEKLRAVASQRQRGLMVVMEDVQNLHNLAAIARSCDAFGVQQIGVTVANPANFDPQAGKAVSTSASKWLDYRLFEGGTAACIATLRAEGWHVMATALREDALDIYEADLAQHEKLALLVGNEKEGLSATAVQLADSVLTIPMLGMIQSFNVSVATALSLYEITRQRRASGRDYRFSDAEAKALLSSFLGR